MGKKSNIALLTDEQFVNAVKIINSAETVKDLIDAFPNALNFKMASYHHFPAIGSVSFKNLSQYYSFNMPQKILDYYDQNKEYRDDPGIIAAFQKGQFIWLSDMSSQPYVIEREHVAAGKMAYKAVGEGLSFPLYGPNNRKGYLFIAFEGITKDGEPIFPYKIQALAQILHTRYCLLIEKVQSHVKLTPREAEVLELISFGKSNIEIGLILKISPNTVAVYVKRIFIKLNVSDRVSAAMRAETIKIKA